jgi:hypothetical protein
MTENDYLKVMRLAAIRTARDVLDNAIDLDDPLRRLVSKLTIEANKLRQEIALEQSK